MQKQLMPLKLIAVMRTIRTYSKLILLPTFEERFRYLQVPGAIGADTFGYDRYLNQKFYTSAEWRRIRRDIIIRDNCCDLGIEGRDIFNSRDVIIHHMNPISAEDLINRTEFSINPEYLICVSFDTHNAIHFGDENLLKSKELVIRKPNDTCPWRK